MSENKGKVKILLAEDDKLSITYITTVLTSEGFDVIHAANGDDAVRIVREMPDLSLVLMDIKMPDKSGIEATLEIRKFNKSIPVIAQTAFALAGDREKLLEAGCTDYISKPISRKDLVALINKYL
ncbi:response regulator [Anaerophaga thermohalophila]|jgi:CheY-like chemotaxis protein|uniref:response regulator n=1 Tax=Anaerophaga thermohalophila TaxID=177400 RepID=UPI00031775DC|nr:response regulator [Anaerophaga thermohalophila]